MKNFILEWMLRSVLLIILLSSLLAGCIAVACFGEVSFRPLSFFIDEILDWVSVRILIASCFMIGLLMTWMEN